MMKGREKIKDKIWRISKMSNVNPALAGLTFGIVFQKNYLPKRFLNSWVSMGTAVKRSPTIP